MSKRLLVVDNDADILFGLKELLESPHTEVSTAETKEEADALLEASRFDVIIVDLMLSSSSPEEGLQLVRSVKAACEGTKTIVITGCGEADIMDRAYEAGADMFFAKPVPGRVLEGASQKLCAG